MRKITTEKPRGKEVSDAGEGSERKIKLKPTRGRKKKKKERKTQEIWGKRYFSHLKEILRRQT